METSDGKRMRKWLDAVELVEKQDPDIKDREGTQPARYHAGLKKSTKVKRDAHFKKHGKKADDDSSAYKPSQRATKTQRPNHPSTPSRSRICTTKTVGSVTSRSV